MAVTELDSLRREEREVCPFQEGVIRAVYSFMGPPGVGKDTQADLMRDRLARKNLRMIKRSTGDELRAAFKDPFNPYHELVIEERRKSEAGGLVSDVPVNTIAGDFLAEGVRNQVDVLGVTGYPRTEGQLHYFENLCQDVLEERPWEMHYIVLNGTLETSRARSDARNLEVQEHNERYKDQPDLQRVGRDDDKPEVVNRRFSEHVNGAAKVAAAKIEELSGRCDTYLQDLLAGEAKFPHGVDLMTFSRPGENPVYVHVVNALRPIKPIRNSLIIATRSINFAR